MSSPVCPTEGRLGRSSRLGCRRLCGSDPGLRLPRALGLWTCVGGCPRLPGRATHSLNSLHPGFGQRSPWSGAFFPHWAGMARGSPIDSWVGHQARPSLHSPPPSLWEARGHGVSGSVLQAQCCRQHLSERDIELWLQAQRGFPLRGIPCCSLLSRHRRGWGSPGCRAALPGSPAACDHIMVRLCEQKPDRWGFPGGVGFSSPFWPPWHPCPAHPGLPGLLLQGPCGVGQMGQTGREGRTRTHMGLDCVPASSCSVTKLLDLFKLLFPPQ